MFNSKNLRVLAAGFVIALASPFISNACTNIIVGKNASADGSTFLTYSADSHVLYGELYHWPARTWPAGSMLKVNEWDTGKYLGEIKQAARTYNVVGNMNEHQLAIAETTFGGRKELRDTTGIMDYGSLIYIALQRSKNAQEAIEVMTSLVEEYGYYSSGESFSIVDPNEAWIMEMISKGPDEKGAVWVAVRIPDGAVSGHANQARITTIDFKDRKNVKYSSDVVSFAKKKGYFSGKKEDFDFSAAYAPLDFGAVRFCDARVWSFFRQLDPDTEKYIAYLQGESKERLPLYVFPKKKVELNQVKEFMRDHYEGTPLDMRKDPGAGPFSLPYRWRPLTWKVDGEEYFNERAVATQQTGFSFVAQMRSWIPSKVGGVLWFGLDDAATSVYMPIYCGITKIPESVAVGNGNIIKYSPTSSFWLFNQVANLAYTKYSYMQEDIRPTMQRLESGLEAQQDSVDQAAIALFEESGEEGLQFINNYSNEKAQYVFDEWKSLFEFLTVKYLDGNIKRTEGRKFITNGHADNQPASPEFPGYSNEFYQQVIENAGEKLQMKEME